jgi:hypothetical protein
VQGAYANASDARTLHPLLPGTDCLLVCSGPDCLPALEVALELRVPFIAAGPIGLEQSSRRVLAERAWSAQVPVVLEAGAVPGLAGVAAELLVRTLREIETLRIATTGPWDRTPAAKAAQERVREPKGLPQHHRVAEWSLAALRGLRLELAGPLGRRALSAAPAPDLEEFARAHCVGSLIYLEPAASLLERALEWVVGESPPASFVLKAEAAGPGTETAQVEIEASDACAAAAASLGALVRGVLERQVPAGLSSPGEALNPFAHVGALEKAGLRVAVSARERATGPAR